MDPQLKSILTSILMAVSTSIAAWFASQGLIPGTDQSTFANDLVTVVFGLISAGLVWYKSQAHTPTAQIAAVNNASNGVKVVAATAPAPQVDAPVKVPSK